MHNFEIFPDDTFLVSYPRSGNTWFRFLLGNYLLEEECNFRNLKLTSIEAHSTPDDVIQQIKRPRIFKSHLPYTPQYKRVAYLLRDGRDVAVSYYFYNLKFKHIRSDVTFEKFLTDYFNTGNLSSFGKWGDHVNIWLDNLPQESIVIRYEDMKENPEHELHRFLDFCNISVDLDKLSHAVKVSSFDNMQAIEQKDSEIIPVWEKSNRSINFVRRGEPNQWQELFTGELLGLFLESHGSSLAKVGYIPYVFDSAFRWQEAGYKTSQEMVLSYKRQIEILEKQLIHNETRCERYRKKVIRLTNKSKRLRLKIQNSSRRVKCHQMRIHNQKSKIILLERKLSGIQTSKIWKVKEMLTSLKNKFLGKA